MRLILIGLITLSMSSCGIFNKNKVETNELLYSKWKVVAVNNVTVADKANNVDHYFILDKDNKRYTAITGCNTLGGEYSTSGSFLKFGIGISTMMACPDMSLEDNLKKTFPKVEKYSIQDNKLSLLDAKGNTLVKLQLANKENNKSLTGTWELDYIAEPGKTMKDLFPQTKPVITFEGKEQTFSGNGSCNRYSGTYESENHKIDFGAIASTRMACPSGAGESIYFKALDKVNSYSIQGNTLTFIMGDIAIMRFQKK